MKPRWHSCHLWHRHGINDTLSWSKGRFWCKTMAQYGTVCNICHPHLMTYMLCHPWHHDGTHVTYDTDMESMTPSWQQWHHTVLPGKGRFWCKTMAQYGTVCNICHPHLMTYMLCHPWHHDGTHVTYDTDMESMTPSWQQWHHTVLAGKGRFWCKTMAQYGTVCNICHPHLTMTYMLCHPWHHDGTHVTYDTDMESMTPSWQQWHHTVLAGKGRFWCKTMAQYGTVCNICHPTSPWRTCYVTHDTTMAPMSPMTQTWNQWHYHGNNDTTLSSSWERTILV